MLKLQRKLQGLKYMAGQCNYCPIFSGNCKNFRGVIMYQEKKPVSIYFMSILADILIHMNTSGGVLVSCVPEKNN